MATCCRVSLVAIGAITNNRLFFYELQKFSRQWRQIFSAANSRYISGSLIGRERKPTEINWDDDQTDLPLWTIWLVFMGVFTNVQEVNVANSPCCTRARTILWVNNYLLVCSECPTTNSAARESKKVTRHVCSRDFCRRESLEVSCLENVNSNFSFQNAMEKLGRFFLKEIHTSRYTTGGLNCKQTRSRFHTRRTTRNSRRCLWSSIRSFRKKN